MSPFNLRHHIVGDVPVYTNYNEWCAARHIHPDQVERLLDRIETYLNTYGPSPKVCGVVESSICAIGIKPPVGPRFRLFGFIEPNMVSYEALTVVGFHQSPEAEFSEVEYPDSVWVLNPELLPKGGAQ